mmetsp:Transcript_5512/g.12990  ORF Transcript_5512/g.12990 Transcript_5512/m.12990 type:complete len:99 (+) Transcript_5512:1554-1850(+)
MSRIYVGNLDERATERELEDEFGRYGRIHYTWVARKPPGFAFIDFEDPRDAEDAVRKLDGEYVFAHGVTTLNSMLPDAGGDRLQATSGSAVHCSNGAL